MAFSLFSPRSRIVNLVFNDHSIRFVELKQVNPPTAQRWSERLLPPGIINDGKILGEIEYSPDLILNFFNVAAFLSTPLLNSSH